MGCRVEPPYSLLMFRYEYEHNITNSAVKTPKGKSMKEDMEISQEEEGYPSSCDRDFLIVSLFLVHSMIKLPFHPIK